MKYFLDTEFHEYMKQPRTRLGFKVGEPINTIELISIGIVSEDGRELYLISKDFDFDEAWDNKWIRENILQKIAEEIVMENSYSDWPYDGIPYELAVKLSEPDFVESIFIIHGHTREEIRGRIFSFCSSEIKRYGECGWYSLTNPEFYAYYGASDWTLFCWIFGSMLTLPKGFQRYCRDLKQMFDEKQDWLRIPTAKNHMNLKSHQNYPKAINEHNALDDAKWNLELYKFLLNL